MQNFSYLMGLLSVITSVAQYVSYMRDILKEKTKPHLFSWFVWGLPCGIILVAQMNQGEYIGAWATGVTTIFCTIIFFLAFFYGEKEIKFLDWLCLLLALLAIACWMITKNPLGAVILITIADVLGFVPTYRKSYSKPFEETQITYFLGGLKWLLAITAMKIMNVTVVLYPATMCAANWMLVVMLIMRRKKFL